MYLIKNKALLKLQKEITSEVTTEFQGKLEDYSKGRLPSLRNFHM